MAVHIGKKLERESAASKHSPTAPAPGAEPAPAQPILWFDQAESSDISRVGGKNAGLAEVTRTLASAGIRVPPGFAVTAAAYRAYIEANGLEPKLRQHLEAYHGGKESLEAAGAAIRRLVVDAELPAAIAEVDPHCVSRIGKALRGIGPGSGRPEQCDCRGPAAGELRRPAGDFSQRARGS